MAPRRQRGASCPRPDMGSPRCGWRIHAESLLQRKPGTGKMPAGLGDRGRCRRLGVVRAGSGRDDRARQGRSRRASRRKRRPCCLEGEEGTSQEVGRSREGDPNRGDSVGADVLGRWVAVLGLGTDR